MIPIKTFGIKFFFIVTSLFPVSLLGQKNKNVVSPSDSIQVAFYKFMNKTNFINHEKRTFDFVSPLNFFKQYSELQGWDSLKMSSFYSMVGTHLSYCGDYSKAIAFYDSSYLSFVQNQRINNNFKARIKDSILVSSLKLENAINIIQTSAKKSRIVIIGEAHHIPEHRILTYSLLRSLRDAGYNYIGLEALQDSLVLDNPIGVSTGVYTSEPIYGNMIRYAKKLGFKIISYDCNSCGSMNQREEVAAERISQLLLNNPNMKIILHTGYSHGSEKQIPGVFNPLVFLLKKTTGINPVTIDQSTLKETTTNTIYSYYNKALIKRFNVDQPMIVLDSLKNPINFSDLNETFFDFTIVNPSIEKINSIFLKENTNLERTIIDIKKFKSSNAIVFQLYSTDEFNQIGDFNKIVPLCQRLITNENLYSVITPKGNVYLVIRNLNNKIIAKSKLHIK
jgi:hypothetical protein